MFVEARNDDLSQEPHDTLAGEAGAEQQGTPLPIAPLFHSLERTRRVQKTDIIADAARDIYTSVKNLGVEKFSLSFFFNF